nr:PREDICTED: cGMP-dependent protein kinase, isozyme 2 forms cD5/T2-like [Apteryx mantelli mantelli]
MEECTFAPGHVIIREGDEGENFYIILKGEVRVTQKVEGKEKVIRVLGAGEHFGEISLLQNIRRTASCRAQGEVTCITVAKEFFGSFRDGQYVYLLLEFCQGGELWTKLREVYGAGAVPGPCRAGAVDFGFAKVLGRGEKTYSLCGTPEPPFHSMEPQKIYSRILDGIFSFPAFLSEAACSLIAKLCSALLHIGCIMVPGVR